MTVIDLTAYRETRSTRQARREHEETVRRALHGLRHVVQAYPGQQMHKAVKAALDAMVSAGVDEQLIMRVLQEETDH